MMYPLVDIEHEQNDQWSGAMYEYFVAHQEDNQDYAQSARRAAEEVE